MPHSGPGTPISTFLCPRNGGAWQEIERKVPWDCRIIPKYCHWLCEEAASVVVIVHHQLARGDVAGGPSLEEPEFTMVGEIFTDIEPVKRAAERRGHKTMPSMTLPDYDFYKNEDQQRCHGQVKKKKPYCLVVAFPCTVWSPLQRIGRNQQAKVDRLRKRRTAERRLVRFSVEMARSQLAKGKHFVIENPAPSLAWKVCPELKALMSDGRVYTVTFDQ